MIGRRVNEEGLTEEEVKILAATDKAWPITTAKSAEVDAKVSRYIKIKEGFRRLLFQGKVYNRGESGKQTTSQIDINRDEVK